LVILLVVTAIACNSFTWYDSTYTSTPIIAPIKVLTNKRGCDSTVTLNLTISPCTDIAEINKADNIAVYPNPANDEIHVISEQLTVLSIEIYNLLGERVYQSSVTSHSLSGTSPMTNVPMTNTPITINIADMPSGVYIMEVKTESGVGVRKFVKE
jgi:hypothetical protein